MFCRQPAVTIQFERSLYGTAQYLARFKPMDVMGRGIVLTVFEHVLILLLYLY